MPLVNPFTVRPIDLKPGDVMACVVTIHMLRHGNRLTYRMYRCTYPATATVDGVPQGTRMREDEVIVEQLFPTVLAIEAKPDL